MKGIQQSLWNYFQESENFSLKEANDYILNELNKDVNLESIRARIYEGINKGLFSRVAKGVYHVNVKDKSCLLVNGDGRDLSFIKDNSIDAIITDHPYSLKKSHIGGNRNLAEYDCFQYVEKDFSEKYRVLKPGGFLVEMLPSKNGDNWRYINKIHELAEESGLDFYAVVPWKKGDFVINQGRNSKNTEDIYFFSKGKARNLRLDAKANKNLAIQNNLEIGGLASYEIASLLEDNGLEVKYMSGTNKMLPTEFNYQPTSIKARIHQAEKPIQLFEDIIEYVSLPNELLLDQFAGSGNLGIAALNKGRDSILIEQNKETFNTMQSHIEDYYERDEGIMDKKEKFKIQIWETEEDRDNGYGFDYLDTFENKEDAIEEAKSLMDLNDYACIEVIDSKAKSYYWSDGKTEEYEKNSITEGNLDLLKF